MATNEVVCPYCGSRDVILVDDIIGEYQCKIDFGRFRIRGNPAYAIEHGYEVLKYDTYYRYLRNARKTFLAGLPLLAIGVFVLWLVVSQTTIFVLGNTRYILDPMDYGTAGGFFAAIGIGCLLFSTYIKISYPSKLKKLKQSLMDDAGFTPTQQT